jgi:hypothetical protein
MITEPFLPGCNGAVFHRWKRGPGATLVCLLALLAIVSPIRAGVLANSDFSEGRAHWGGDAEEMAPPDPTSVTGTDTAAAPATGVTINLKKDRWTLIYQSFTVRDPQLYYTITFKLSQDYKLTSQGKDDQEAADLSNVPGVMKLYNLPIGHWTMFYTGTDPTDETSINTKSLDPNTTTVQSQTLTGKLINLNNGADANLILAFPPGEGSITLTTVSLSPDNPEAGP